MGIRDNHVAEETTAGRPRVQHLEAGEVLCREGDVDDRVWMLVEGRVEVLRGQERLAEIGVDDVFLGEMAALTGGRRTASLRALGPATVVTIGSIEQLFTNPAWGLKLARVLALRLEAYMKRGNVASQG